MVRTVPDGRMSVAMPGKDEVGDGVGDGVGGGGGVPVGVGAGPDVDPSVGVGVEVGAGTEAAAVAEGPGVADWFPQAASRTAASVRAPTERRISPPTLAVAHELRTS
jgi:hypothetical protein